VSYTVIASGTHPRIYKSYTNYLRSTPGPKSSINARSSLSGSPRTLHSPVEPGPGQHSQTLAETTAIIIRCTTLPTSSQPEKPPVVRNTTPRAATTTQGEEAADGHNSRVDSIVCFTAKLRSPNKGLFGDQGHQRQNVQSTTDRQPEGSSAHIPSTATLPQRANPASTQPRLPAPRGPGPTTTASTSPKSTTPPPPTSTQTEGLHRTTILGSYPYDHWRIEHKLRHKATEKDLYRSVNHVSLTGPVV
jgi:hypothetical protein